MKLKDNFELENTRRKLSSVEERLAIAEENSDGNPAVQEWTVTSLRRLVDKLKGEIAEFEANAGLVEEHSTSR